MPTWINPEDRANQSWLQPPEIIHQTTPHKKAGHFCLVPRPRVAKEKHAIPRFLSGTGQKSPNLLTTKMALPKSDSCPGTQGVRSYFDSKGTPLRQKSQSKTLSKRHASTGSGQNPTWPRGFPFSSVENCRNDLRSSARDPTVARATASREPLEKSRPVSSPKWSQKGGCHTEFWP